MKKICYLIILAIGLFQACTPDTELIFDKSASERMNEALTNYQDLLVSDTHGWLVEYYPHSSRTYGGFNLFFQFTAKEATVKTEVESTILIEDVATSSYSLGQDMGPTLNFDTYNEVLNFFSDPALAVGGGAGYGFEGDYEFIFMSGNASEIILRGKKTKNTIRLTPITADAWESYRDDVLAIKDNFGSASYSMTIDGEVVAISKPAQAFNRFVFTYQEEEETVTTNMAYIITSTGMHFYEPLTINGVEMQDFTFNSTSSQMTSKDGKVIIQALFPPVEDVFVNSLSSSQWFFSSSKMGSGFLPTFNSMKSGIAGLGEQLRYAWIGFSVDSGKPSFSFGSLEGTTTWYGSNLLNITKADDTAQIKIETTSGYEVNWDYYINYVPALSSFSVLLGGTYTITTTDPLKNITSVTLTNTADATRTFTLSLDEVQYP